MKKQERKLGRSFSMKLDARNYLEFDGLALDLNNRKILGIKGGEMLPVIGETLLEHSRAKEKGGKKVIHQSRSLNNDAWFDSNRQLLDYDHLIAIDTNTKHFERSSVSITAAYHLIPRSHTPTSATCHGAVLALVEMWNIKEKQENVGWWQILQAIEKSPKEFSGNIGLIVDSDLGNHELFNSGKQPIIGDYFLPQNVKLIYASDKGGPEHLSTKLIRYCHKLATDLYNEELLILNVENLYKGIDGLYSHIRQWDTEQRNLQPFI